MHKKFNHEEIEKKWQEKWQADGLYDAGSRDESKGKEYVLVEFPYPSGNLHIGHWYAFAVPDIYVRAQRMKGKQVLYPFGFDAFGLPAENAAIKRGLDPKAWTESNIEYMKEQIRQMGNAFSWDTTLSTTDPEYYKWTQWMFTQLFEKDIAYRGKGTVNWCPSCQTVLANEQVVNDACERCGTPVEKKEMDEWKMRITEYADRLVDDLDALDWPSHIKELQRNWIGRSKGAQINFKLSSEDTIDVFTTCPDTLYGVTYIVLAPEHPLLATLDIQNRDEVSQYQETAAQKDERTRTAEGKEKTGVRLEGVTATNPANGEEIPVYVADYVLGSYGTGAVMAVPAHDRRDSLFAKKFGIKRRFVIDPKEQFESLHFSAPEIDGERITDDSNELWYSILQAEITKLESEADYTGSGYLINSGEFDGLSSEKAKEKIIEKVDGKTTNTYRLRDWSIGRQRYWGVPIPIVYDPEGKPHPIPKEHLPWILPTDVDFKPTGVPPLAKSKELKKRTEEIFGAEWTPEVETMDTFVDSSWYFLRYIDNKNDEELSSKEKQEEWMPVDLYFGGSEHTTLHLLYSRFIQKALFDMGVTSIEEPYKMRINRGLVLGPDGNKMSKSKGNIIDPDGEVSRVGADAVKMYLAFMGPYGEAANYPWDLGGIAGTRRFLERVCGLSEHVADSESEDMTRLIHKTVRKVREDIEVYKFNTAISAMMVYINDAEKKGITEDSYRMFLKILAPFAPHLTEELWCMLGESTSIHKESLPEADAALTVESEVTIGVQINGKVRGDITLAPDADEAMALTKVRESERLQEHIRGGVQKVIYVPGRILSIILE